LPHCGSGVYDPTPIAALLGLVSSLVGGIIAQADRHPANSTWVSLYPRKHLTFRRARTGSMSHIGTILKTKSQRRADDAADEGPRPYLMVVVLLVLTRID
jgi:hypothetical protein